MKGMQSNMVQNKHIFAICCLACILRAKKKKKKTVDRLICGHQGSRMSVF